MCLHLPFTPHCRDAGITKISTLLYVNPVPSLLRENKQLLFEYTSVDRIELFKNGGAAVTQTISGLSVAPFSEYSFIHIQLRGLALNGTYEVTVWRECWMEMRSERG